MTLQSDLQVNLINQGLDFLEFETKSDLLLVTGHRRENIGTGFKNIVGALKRLAKKYPDLKIVYPVHLNPNVKDIVYKELSSYENIFLLKPLDYLNFIFLMNISARISF